jgi:predicted phosphodiesterase
MRGLVISDLHLQAKRSAGESLLRAIQGTLDRCDTLILNGDTFDFRWSTLGGETESIDTAIGWMEAMDGRTLHFIHGNHDCLYGFRERLLSLTQKWPNLHLHEDTLRLGTRIFLHGDCANRKMDPAALKAMRKAWAEDKPRGPFQAKLYDLADQSGISLAFHRGYFPQAIVVSRVAHYLDAAQPGWSEFASECYFGHTHLPFRNHRNGDVHFHNTGSGIRGMGFQPLEFHDHDLPP